MDKSETRLRKIGTRHKLRLPPKLAPSGGLFVDFAFDFAQATKRILSVAEVSICKFTILFPNPMQKNVAIKRFPSEGKLHYFSKFL